VVYKGSVVFSAGCGSGV